MSNTDKLKECFISTFKNKDVEKMKYKETELWDSVGHISLLARIEDAFDIMIEPEDMMSMHTFKQIMSILENTYNVDFSI